MKGLRAVLSVLFVGIHMCGAISSLVELPQQFGPDGQSNFIIESLTKGTVMFSPDKQYAFCHVQYLLTDFKTKLPIEGYDAHNSMHTQGYSTTGFVAFTVYWGTRFTSDPTCSTPSFTAGFAANSCIQSSSFSIKFQLTQGIVYTHLITSRICSLMKNRLYI